ncbi:MAG: hypothetical protein OEN23_17740 [Paracoccaceae bacterium]|nr:hypothetical protein [Paracoccaceae bacterium]
MRLTLATFPARFRMRFAHGSASRAETENVICVAEEDGLTGVGEGCPRAYVTGETVATAARFFAKHRASLGTVGDIAGLGAWIGDNAAAVSLNPAAFAAIELALIDLFARRAGQGIEPYLGLPPARPAAISAVFGVTGRNAAAAMATGYRLFAMTDAKVKVSPDHVADRARLSLIRRILGDGARLRIDANNLFSDPGTCIAHVTALGLPVWAIEEPLAARDFAGMEVIAQATGARIILDESATRIADLERLDGPRWIVNLRVSKLGGLIRSLEMLRVARERGLGVIVGCHVGETSLLTRAALALAAAGGESVQAVECAYGGYLLAHDLTRPSLRFGRGGVVTPPNGVGLGLVADRSLLRPVS